MKNPHTQRVVSITSGKAPTAPAGAIPFSNGIELHAKLNRDIFLPGGKTALIPTGFSMPFIDGNRVGVLNPHQDLNDKLCLLNLHTYTIIDQTNPDEIMIPIWNCSRKSCLIKIGDPLCEFLLSTQSSIG